jgi:hypothetical protein
VEKYSKQRAEFCTVPGVKAALTYTGGPATPSCRVSLSNG